MGSLLIAPPPLLQLLLLLLLPAPEPVLACPLFEVNTGLDGALLDATMAA